MLKHSSAALCIRCSGMEIISKADAITQGLNRYFTGKPCKWGHVALRSVRDDKCVTCTLWRQNKKRAEDRARAFPNGRDPWKSCADGMKVCRGCREVKETSAFSPDKRASDGLQSRCRDCCAAAHSQRYHADPAAAREARKAYYKANRQAVLRWNSESRQRNRVSVLAGKKDYYERVKLDPEWQAKQAEYRAANRDVKRSYDQAYRARDPQRAKERANEWRKRNPEKRSAIIKAYSARRRANCADGDPTAVVAAWEAAAEKVCYWCGKDCRDNYHIDHYQPLARGGKHVIANLVIACPPCNHRKNAKDPCEFAASLGRLF